MSKSGEKVSVIVPVYNTEKYVEKCITSILSQTYINLELIVVDNASTDSSMRRVEQLAQNDSRIRIIKNQKTYTAGYSRNIGLDNATGRYIWFVDSDDYAQPNFLEVMLERMGSSDVNIVQCCYNSFDDYGNYMDYLPFYQDKLCSGRELCDYMSKFVGLCGPNTMVWNKLYKKEVFDNIRFYENVEYEDMYLVYKLLYDEEKVLWISDRLMNWRKSLSSNTSVANYSPGLINELFAYIERAGWYKEKNDEELYRRTLKRLYYISAQHLYLNSRIMQDEDKIKREELIKTIIRDVYKKLKKMDCWGLRTRLRMKYIFRFPKHFGKKSILHTVDFRI